MIGLCGDGGSCGGGVIVTSVVFGISTLSQTVLVLWNGEQLLMNSE